MTSSSQRTLASAVFFSITGRLCDRFSHDVANNGTLWFLNLSNWFEPGAQLRENRKKGAKALLYIQLALDDTVFPRIAAAKTSREAWNTLKQEYMGDKKVIQVKLHTLRRNFELLAMQKDEYVQGFMSRVADIVNSMRAYGEIVDNNMIVSKVLRTLTSKFDHVVAAIEETKDLSRYTFDELMGSLLAHEDRLNRSSEKVEEKSFQVKDESSQKEKTENSSSGGRRNCRGGFRGRGRGRGRGKGRFTEGHGRQNMGPIQCYNCKKYGHKEANCWFKNKDEQKANFT
ncbi:uncharacterized protein LOC141657108 [Silene latifolia]|uniref:uncharacterized protein LOC141657108 n=1 Tax=Silene latifolia TaxID=37657 RepID=UPI003D77123E